MAGELEYQHTTRQHALATEPALGNSPNTCLDTTGMRSQTTKTIKPGGEKSQWLASIVYNPFESNLRAALNRASPSSFFLLLFPYLLHSCWKLTSVQSDCARHTSIAARFRLTAGPSISLVFTSCRRRGVKCSRCVLER